MVRVGSENSHIVPKLFGLEISGLFDGRPLAEYFAPAKHFKLPMRALPVQVSRPTIRWGYLSLSGALLEELGLPECIHVYANENFEHRVRTPPSRSVEASASPGEDL